MFLSSKNISISYGVTVCNEHLELERLLSFLVEHVEKNDEIIVLSDESGVTQEVLEIVKRFQKSIKHISYPLNKNFAQFKNKLLEAASGDYLFQIDADEVPNSCLIKRLKSYLFLHQLYDCFLVPRVNYVEGITSAHIEKWNWKVDDKGRINYPDLQMRIFKLNKNIRWVNAVHETLINWKFKKKMPYKRTENFCLYHYKEIKRQERQNNFYDTIQP